jgi:hypothetical protein
MEATMWRTAEGALWIAALAPVVACGSSREVMGAAGAGSGDARASGAAGAATGAASPSGGSTAGGGTGLAAGSASGSSAGASGATSGASGAAIGASGAATGAVGGSAGSAGNDGGAGSCPSPVSSAPAVTLADFENGVIPDSDTMTEGFRGSDVANGTIIHPGAANTSGAARFDYMASNAVFYQGMARQQYLDGSPTYHPDLGNAVELYVRLPAGSMLLSDTTATFGFWSYNWLHGDPWVGTNATGGNLTDSQMHGYSNLRLATAAAGQWQHVVLATSAFAQSRGNYHFYAARAVVEDQTFFGSLRQFEIVALGSVTATPTTADLDELRLITLPPTASVCPPFAARSASAAAGDVVVPIAIANPTAQARGYRLFVSSEIGLDRATLEGAMHDTDSVAAVDDLQGGVGADGGLGAAELFAADAAGHPTGQSLVAAGQPLAVAAGATFSAVLVHHVKAAMLGAPTQVTSGGHAYNVRRNTLTTSVIVWDPAAPPAKDASVVFTGSNADSDHAAPPGFPAYVAPPAGWASTDVRIDQAGGTFVSVLTLTP